MNHRKSAIGRSRDFGTEGAGKGDADRVTDTKAYAANYDAIDWGRKPVNGLSVLEDTSWNGPCESWNR